MKTPTLLLGVEVLSDKKYICTYPDQEGAICTYGEASTIEESIEAFRTEILTDIVEPVQYAVYERISLIEKLASDFRGVYIDGILEDLFEECAFEDIWPDKTQSEILERRLVGCVKEWVRSQKSWANMWQCGEIVKVGVIEK